VRHQRCPRASTDPNALSVVSAYGALDRFGALPVAGGMMDQHPRFLEFVRIVDIERAGTEQIRESDEADYQRKLAAAVEDAKAQKRSR
jgi:hypothetical protein